ncbi:PEP-CTERM sorting domain-containing protein [Duganella sp.]|uniref:PEP-CTERM sorting domain-containing protein n=1 Tax=Duganella sp. TaxID=1904440 RepID=UPI0031E15A96
MGTILKSAVLALAFSAAAANATTYTLYNDVGNGTLSGAYPDFTLTGANAIGSRVSLTTYTGVIDADQLLTFNYTYTSYDEDGADFDPAGYLLNGQMYQLSPVGIYGPITTNGTVSVSLHSGDNFGWYVRSLDSQLGAATLAVSVAAVPEPETYAMLFAGLGILGFAVRRKRTAA